MLKYSNKRDKTIICYRTKVLKVCVLGDGEGEDATKSDTKWCLNRVGNDPVGGLGARMSRKLT